MVNLGNRLQSHPMFWQHCFIVLLNVSLIERYLTSSAKFNLVNKARYPWIYQYSFPFLCEKYYLCLVWADRQWLFFSSCCDGEFSLCTHVGLLLFQWIFDPANYQEECRVDGSPCSVYLIFQYYIFCNFQSPSLEFLRKTLCGWLAGIPFRFL